MSATRRDSIPVEDNVRNLQNLRLSNINYALPTGHQMPDMKSFDQITSRPRAFECEAVGDESMKSKKATDIALTSNADASAKNQTLWNTLDVLEPV